MFASSKPSFALYEYVSLEPLFENQFFTIRYDLAQVCSSSLFQIYNELSSIFNLFKYFRIAYIIWL